MKKKILALAIVSTMLLSSVSANAMQTDSEITMATVTASESRETIDGFKYSVESRGAVITDYIGSAVNVVIPSSIDGVSVTEIGLSAFKSCESIRSVTIPSSVTSIDYFAFEECKSLESITIPNSVTSMGNCIFRNCESLTSVVLPNSITSVSDSTFEGCTSLTSVTVPNSVTAIGKRAFSNCTSLTGINIPSDVELIDFWAFEYCTSLKSIDIPSSVKSIDCEAFKGCTSLTAIDVDSESTSFSSLDGVLLNNKMTELIVYPSGKKDTSYTVPSDVKVIGSYAFYCCTLLENVTIHNGVNDIGIPNFVGCNSLTDINVDDDNILYTSKDGVLFDIDMTEIIAYPAGKKAASYTIPSSVEKIWQRAFWRCAFLTEIEIPDSVTDMGTSAFSDCTSLSGVTIPSSIEGINDSAFSNCNSLTSVTIPASVNIIRYGAFENCTSLRNVYYAGSEEQWSDIEISSYNDSLTNALIHYNGNVPPYNCGDADGDGAITSNDALITLRAAVGLQDYDKNLKAIIDVNGDGSVDSSDSLAILRYSVGYRDTGVNISL